MRTFETLRRLRHAARGPIKSTDPTEIDPELIQALATPFERFCDLWYGLEVEGVENIPEGPALLVGNHNSGSMFLEMMGAAAHVYRLHPGSPWVGLAHDAIIDLPVIGKVLHRLGALRANHESADAAFRLGHKVVVFPGGNREAYRPFRRRYSIEFGDRRGFLKLAIRHDVPIVPMVYVGGHSGFIVLSDGKKLARFLRAERWLRSDTWPLWLGLPFGIFLGPGMHIPFPVKCYTRFLPPIHPRDFGPPDDPATLEAAFKAIETAMQEAMDELAEKRRRRPWPLRR